MRYQQLVSGSSLIALAGLMAGGCSSGSSGRGGGAPLPVTPTAAPAVSEAQSRELLEATTLVSQASTLPLLVAMDELSPGNFPSTGTSGSTTTVVSGGTTTGTANFDFSGSTSTSGSITVDYSGAAGAATLVMSFVNFNVTTSTSNLAINGTLNYVASYSGSNATVTTSGSLTVVLDGITQTIAINLTTDYDGVLKRSVIAGTSTITHSQLGTWSITLAGVTSSEDTNGNVVLSAGTATLTRTLPFPATAVYVFSGNSAGTFTITPSGITGSFQL